MSRRAPQQRVVKYMHTLNGRPAFFRAKDGAIFVVPPTRLATLRDTLRQIRADQKVTQITDKRLGLTGRYLYDYVQVVVDE